MPCLPDPGKRMTGVVFYHHMTTRSRCAIATSEPSSDHELGGNPGFVAFKVGDQLTEPLGAVPEASERDVAAVAEPASGEHRLVAVVEDNATVIAAASIAEVGFLAVKRGLLSGEKKRRSFTVLFQGVCGQRFFPNFLRGLVVGFLFGADFLSSGRLVCLALLFYVLRILLAPGQALRLELFEIGRTVCTLISRILGSLLSGFGGYSCPLSRCLTNLVSLAPGAVIRAPRNALFIISHVRLHQLRSLVTAGVGVRDGGYVSSIATIPLIAKGGW